MTSAALRRWALASLVVAWAGAITAADIPLTVYGVVATGELDASAAAWFSANDPGLFRRLVIGQVTISGTDAEAASDVQRALYRAVLAPLASRGASGWTITGYRVARIEATAVVGGSVTTTVIRQFTTTTGQPALTPSSAAPEVYAISGDTVELATLATGFLFPTTADAGAFRWTATGLRLRGSADPPWLSAGGARVAALATVTSSPLASFAGAWVQLRDTTSGAYRYVRQDAITLANPALYDPVLMDGLLLTGGSFTPAGGGPASCTYTLAGVACAGSFRPLDALLTANLPQAISAQAAASEQGPPSPGGGWPENRTQHRGNLPEVDATGAETGRTSEFFQGGQDADQSSATLLTQIDRQRANARSGAPVDNQADAGGDRINTPTTGAGASGTTQTEAQASSRSWSLGVSSDGSDAQTQLAYGTGSDGTQTQTISASSILAEHDRELNEEVATRYDDHGTAIEPQAKPIVLDATGTVPQARVEGDVEELYSKADVVNRLIAPHLENTVWPGRRLPHHHGAMIYPIDYLDDALCRQYVGRTGIAVPDKSGDPLPGDGDNPYEPVPQGCEAGHPFYDFDDDGDLDRWYSDDPFDGGYRKLRISWREEGGGSHQLGDFDVHPAYTVCVSGMKKPMPDDDGHWVANEDLLFTIGHEFRPFHHRSLHLTGYKTYYASGFITPLDPIDAGDRTLYQLALRNTAVMQDPSDAGGDGASPDDLVPTVEVRTETKLIDRDGDGVPEQYTSTYTIDWYPGLTADIETPPWTWMWSDPGFVLPTVIADQPNVPAVFVEVMRDATGTVVLQRKVARPLFTDPDTHAVAAFDPSLIPVAQPSTQPSRPVADTYLWDYPQGRSTAEGGTQPANPNAWQFPWNLAWNNDPHSRRRSQRAFQLNSVPADSMTAYYPQFAGLTPKITHDGLTAEDGPRPIRIQWLLRENADQDPPADATLAQWRDGHVLYTLPGWMRGMPWLAPGRAPFHVVDWDGRSDMWNPDRRIAGCRMPAGSRVYDVAAGVSEYYFRGRKYKVYNRNQQLALLRRMWNYSFTGYEYPVPETTCLPSLCIPQRYDNRDLASPLLNTAHIPEPAGPEVQVDRADANHGGNAIGAMIAEMADANAPATRNRQATERRARLMREQILLFSASRGREWELEMARRMPRSVRLVCVEYDDKEYVKAVLGRDGGNVFFPDVTTTTLTDPMGGSHTVETSNEREVLKELAMQWFDPEAPFIGYRNGAMYANNDTGLKNLPGGSRQTQQNTLTNGSAGTLDRALMDHDDGFARHLPEGLPAGLAAYAFLLGQRPLWAQQQWAPQPHQPAVTDYLIEFRHPMLVLYHDRASSIYVHYGRNCDPDEVFGHWDDCAPPPASLDITTSEFQRRQRFEAWQDQPTLEHIYDLLHPDGARLLAQADIDLPPAPPDPGPEPIAPTQPDWPGQEPMPPVVALRNWDAYQATPTYAQLTTPPTPQALDGYTWTWAPWSGQDGYDGLSPSDQFARWMQGIPRWDASGRHGFLSVSRSDPDAASYVGGSGNWQEQLAPHGASVWLIGACESSPPDTVGTNRNVSGWDWYRFYASATPETCSGGINTVTISFQASDAATPAAGTAYYVAHDNDGNSPNDGRYYYTNGGPKVAGADYFVPLNLAFYQGYRLGVTQVAWYQAIVDQRSAAIADFGARWAQWQAQKLQWDAEIAAYEAWAAQDAAFQSRHAAWVAHQGTWDAWNAENAALLALKASAASYQQAREAWVSLVVGEVDNPGVSWPGDPAVTLTTLTQFHAIQPQLPIWEAYEWFVDPVNTIPDALPASP